MIRNYLTTALRRLIRNRIYAFTNIIGLAVGLAAAFALLLVAKHEWSFDQYHEHVDRTYRLVAENPERGTRTGAAPYRLTPVISDEIAAVEAIARLRQDEVLIQKDDNFVRETGLARVDEAFFNVFTIDVLQGDASALLPDPRAVVLTEPLAHKYFGDEDALGKTLTIRNKRGVGFDPEPIELIVTGVVAEWPPNSHLAIDLFIPAESVDWGFEQNRSATASVMSRTNSWNYLAFQTYVRLSEGIEPEEVETAFDQLVANQIGPEHRYRYRLQSLSDIHLYSDDILGTTERKGDRSLIYLCGGIATVIILIAGLNYVILSTAQASVRGKEVGVRKVVGARRGNVISQFIGESVLLTVLAWPVAIAITVWLLPRVGQLLDMQLDARVLEQWSILGGLGLVTLVVGLISGSYIAFHLSAFSPMSIFRGGTGARIGKARTFFRSTIIAVQLAIFVVLTMATLIVYRQINYMTRSKDLGFAKESVLSIHLTDRSFRGHYETFKQKLLEHPDILYVSASQWASPATSAPIRSFYRARNRKTGAIVTANFQLGEDWELEEVQTFAYGGVDYDYVEALGLELVAGRSFDQERPGDQEAVVVNESFVRERGLVDPIGISVPVADEIKTVIGVVRDYHTESLYNAIPPLVLHYDTNFSQQVVVKLASGNVRPALTYMEDKWKEVGAEGPFEFTFLDDALEAQYRTEQNFGTLIGYFTSLAILVSCLGLFALALFMTERRTKEIGLRKVLGADVVQLVRLVGGSFVGLSVLAIAIGAPLGAFVMNRWLDQFAYRVEVDVFLFFQVGLLALALTIVSVSYQVVRAAVANPIESLRYE